MPCTELLLNFHPSGTVTPAQWGVIQAEGPDAASFLQGQLTHDVLLLPVGQARFAGYCTAKGRLMASFVVLKISADKFLLICHMDVLAAMVKRLSMFVMRAKLKLTDVSAHYVLRGLVGDAVSAALPASHNPRPWAVTSSLTPAGTAETSVPNMNFAIHLYPAMINGSAIDRAFWIAPVDQTLPEAWSAAIAQFPLLRQEDWQLLEVLSGISMVQAATSEAFVPQMLNYESVDGVSFKKGCYPGQEVVARSQFRGALKRRAYVVSSEAPLTAGQDIFSDADKEQACGTVATAAAYLGSMRASDATSSEVVRASSYWGIVSMQTSAAEQALHAGSADGPSLLVHPLPYPLLEDI